MPNSCIRRNRRRSRVHSRAPGVTKVYAEKARIDQPDTTTEQPLPLDERQYLIIGCADDLWQVRQICERPGVILQHATCEQAAKVAGFSLHAGVAAQAREGRKPERLCRYISRPAISEKRRSLTPSGNIRYQLKTFCNDGTIHVIFEPLDFIARLAALVPKPRVNLTRLHGVFASSKHRVDVTPAKREKGISQR